MKIELVLPEKTSHGHGTKVLIDNVDVTSSITGIDLHCAAGKLNEATVTCFASAVASLEVEKLNVNVLMGKCRSCASWLEAENYGDAQGCDHPILLAMTDAKSRLLTKEDFGCIYWTARRS